MRLKTPRQCGQREREAHSIFVPFREEKEKMWNNLKVNFYFMDLIYFLLASYGLTLILVYGKVFEKVRPKHYFFHCPMCMGFWAGVLLCGINSYTELFTFEHTLVNYLLLGSLSSGTSYILCSLIDDNGLQIRGEL